jgi:hypothetical protein
MVHLNQSYVYGLQCQEQGSRYGNQVDVAEIWIGSTGKGALFHLLPYQYHPKV